MLCDDASLLLSSMGLYLLEGEVSFESFARDLGALVMDGPLSSAVSKLQETALATSQHPSGDRSDPSLVPWNVVDMRHIVSMMANTFVPSSGQSKKPAQLKVIHHTF